MTQPRELGELRDSTSNHPLSQPPTSISRRTPASIAYNMSSIIARSAFRAAPRMHPAPALRRWASAAGEGERQAGKDALKTGAKRDPELYVCSGPIGDSTGSD